VAEAQEREFEGPDGKLLPALLLRPDDARLLYVLAHGAGAGMRHEFMGKIAQALAARKIATFRYQFPYMAVGGKRPDPPRVAEAAVRAAIAGAARENLPMVAGGKSFGGRMTSQLCARESQPLRGLVFIGFPLHPAKQPAETRAVHLADVSLPMLFLQGTRDTLADLELMRGVTGRLGARATLHIVEDADHGFHVLKSSGRTDAQVLDELADTIAAWTS
jgi:predicted alpha/beta-hydrolase family hydrolase